MALFLGIISSMTEALFTEKQIQNIGTNAPLIGAIFDASGHMSIELGYTRKKLASGGVTRYSVVRAIMNYSDSRETKIYRLSTMFGGFVTPLPASNSWRWEIRGQKALYISDASGDYLPSRQKEYRAFRALEGASDTAERIEIAKNWGSPEEEDTLPSIEDYLKLLLNPLFLTGVFEARGFLYYRRGRSGLRDTDNPNIVIDTPRQPLLQALQSMFDGSFENLEDIPRRIRLGKTRTAGFLDIIKPHLLTPLSYYDTPSKFL